MGCNAQTTRRVAMASRGDAALYIRYTPLHAFLPFLNFTIPGSNSISPLKIFPSFLNFTHPPLHLPHANRPTPKRKRKSVLCLPSRRSKAVCSASSKKVRIGRSTTDSNLPLLWLRQNLGFPRPKGTRFGDRPIISRLV